MNSDVPISCRSEAGSGSSRSACSSTCYVQVLTKDRPDRPDIHSANYAYLLLDLLRLACSLDLLSGINARALPCTGHLAIAVCRCGAIARILQESNVQ